MCLLLGHEVLLYAYSPVLFPNVLKREFIAGAIIFTVIAILSVLSYFGFKSRIPLASLLLQVTMDVSKHHKSVYVVAFTALLVQACLSVWACLHSCVEFLTNLPQLVHVHCDRHVRLSVTISVRVTLFNFPLATRNTHQAIHVRILIFATPSSTHVFRSL
jgi:hypothetical protein